MGDNEKNRIGTYGSVDFGHVPPPAPAGGSASDGRRPNLITCPQVVMRASPLPEHGVRPFWAFGWSSGLQHFLPCGQQNLHITTCGSLGSYLYFNMHSALVPKLHCVSWRRGEK